MRGSTRAPAPMPPRRAREFRFASWLRQQHRETLLRQRAPERTQSAAGHSFRPRGAVASSTCGGDAGTSGVTDRPSSCGPA